MEAQGTADYNYLVNGTVLPFGAPVIRNFVNRETRDVRAGYLEGHAQFTITAGIRLGLEPPVHEVNGQQASTNVPLASWLGERAAFAAQGLSQQNAGLIDFIPVSQGTAMYPFHKNWAPRLGLAYSPRAESGISKLLFGGPGKTSIRAGAGMYYDLIGQPLAQTFSSTTPGLSQSFSNPANILTSAQLPRFTDFFTVPSQIVPPAPAGRTAVGLSVRGRRIGIVRHHQQHRPAVGRALHRSTCDFTIGRELGQRFLPADFLRRASFPPFADRSRSGDADQR